MEPAWDNLSCSTQIRGRNFYGNVQIKQKTLILDITQIQKGLFYIFKVSQPQLQKDFKRFLIFKKINDLFDEILQNQRLEISNQNILIIPIDVTYKNKTFQLKLQLQLIQRKFNSQTQKTQYLFGKHVRAIKQKIAIQEQFKSFPKLIKFIGDQTNQKYTSFQISQTKKTIKLLTTNNQHAVFNHLCPLKNKGIFYFKAKIIKSAYKYILIGICSKEIKQNTGQALYLSPLFMGLFLSNGNLYGNGKNFVANSDYIIVQGQSIVKVQVDMNKNSISWFHNDGKLFSSEITKELRNSSITFVVTLLTKGDCLQFLDQ